MIADIGRLLASDESLNHQTVQTFATVSESDHAWTEKVWLSLARRDGALQVDFGLGKYPNRNVMDGFGGISRGREQWTVRASRALAPDPESTAVGPLAYEIVRPLERVRVRLERNEALPLRFDLEFEHELPPFFEERHRQRDGQGFRVVSDVIRYHQAGTVRGWIELDGARLEVAPEQWFGFRDHSWGVRLDVGRVPVDIRPNVDVNQLPFLMFWCPIALERPDGARYEFHHYLQAIGDNPFYFSGYLNHPDGTQERVLRLRHELGFDKRTRRLEGGLLHFDMLSGETRSVEIEPLAETGFHLGTGLYMGLEGHHHGGWRGALHVEGERNADCTEPATLRRIHQLRDCAIRAREGDARGYGIFESVLTGPWPTLNLAAEDSFL